MKFMICLGICLITLFLNGMIFSTAQQIQYSESAPVYSVEQASDETVYGIEEAEELSVIGGRLDKMCDKAAKLEKSTIRTHEALKRLVTQRGIYVE